jgi:hypothetical protein
MEPQLCVVTLSVVFVTAQKELLEAIMPDADQGPPDEGLIFTI